MNHTKVRGHYNGPNYCPNCRCNIRAIALAMEAAKQIDDMGDTPATLQNGNGDIHEDAPKRTYKPRRRTRMVITDEMRATVLRLRAQNASIPEIEKETGMTRASISNTIYSKSKMAVPPSQPIAAAKLKTGDKHAMLLSRILELTNQHRPQIKIARELGVTPKLVRRIQKEQGLSTTAGRLSETAKAQS